MSFMKPKSVYEYSAPDSKISEPSMNELLKQRFQMLNHLTKQNCIFKENSKQSIEELRQVQQTNEAINRNNARALTEKYKQVLKTITYEKETINVILGLMNEIRDSVQAEQKKLNALNKYRPGPRRRELLTSLTEIANSLPLYIEEKPWKVAPPLCGSKPAGRDHILKIGDLVAALVHSKQPDQETSGQSVTTGSQQQDQNWILAEIVHQIRDENGQFLYEVDDIDEDEQKEKERHVLPRNSIIPLPLYRANPDTHPEALFKPDTMVLALYPQTTCFYSGKVAKPPGQASEDYQIMFEDLSYNGGYSPSLEIAQRYVVACPPSSQNNQTTKTIQRDSTTLMTNERDLNLKSSTTRQQNYSYHRC